MTRQEQEVIERLKEHISAILLYVAEAKLSKEEVENELLNIEALVVAIEAIESKSKLESATTTDEVVDFNNMISGGGRIRNLPLPINTVDKPDINTTEQGRSLCNTCKYSDRLQIEEPCFSCIAGFRNYEPAEQQKESLTDSDWTPVSEPPKEDGNYIVSLEDSVDPCAWFYGSKWYYEAFGCTLREYGEHEVTAWQPLPAPYKGGDTE